MSSLSSSAASAKRRASRAASELSSSRRISTHRSSAERSKRSAASVSLLGVVAQRARATSAATVKNAFMFSSPHMCGTRDKRWLAERSFGGGRRQEKSTCHGAIHSRNTSTGLRLELGARVNSHATVAVVPVALAARSEEHTSELQSRENLVCRLLLEKKKKNNTYSRYN